jgi:hypothetical protein
MVDWQVTATTIYCDVLDDEVTILVYPDFSVHCTGYARYGRPGQDAEEELKKRSKKVGRDLGCEGITCWRVTQYRDKLIAEEAGDFKRTK